MKEEEYAKLANWVDDTVVCPSHVPYDTFVAIRRQEKQRYLRNELGKHRKPNQIKKYLQWYRNGESIHGIATKLHFSPCMMARLVLEYGFDCNRKKISEIMKKPSILQDKRLHEEIEECIDKDMDSSPFIDRIRHNMGVEYEYILYEKLKNAGISFESEDMLRDKGLSKTPDAKLTMPVGVVAKDGAIRIVNWIDSKAMFGDKFTHETENLNQVHGYVNRFGSGLVIYWFGFLDTLNNDPDVLVVDDFPQHFIFPGDTHIRTTQEQEMLISPDPEKWTCLSTFLTCDAQGTPSYVATSDNLSSFVEQ